MFHRPQEPPTGPIIDPPKLSISGKVFLVHFIQAIKQVNEDTSTNDNNQHTQDFISNKGMKRLDKLMDNEDHRDVLVEISIQETEDFYPIVNFVSRFLANYEKSMAFDEGKKAQLYMKPKLKFSDTNKSK
jgi:hypothetical protein